MCVITKGVTYVHLFVHLDFCWKRFGYLCIGIPLVWNSYTCILFWCLGLLKNKSRVSARHFLPLCGTMLPFWKFEMCHAVPFMCSLFIVPYLQEIYMKEKSISCIMYIWCLWYQLLWGKLPHCILLEIHSSYSSLSKLSIKLSAHCLFLRCIHI